MSEDRTPAIRERLAAATDGPWRASLVDGIDYEDGSSGYRGGVYPGEKPGPAPIFVTNCIDRRNADLIAHAPDDITWLLSEVERLRRENTVAVQHQREASLAIRSVEGLRKERDDALAAVDAVRGLHEPSVFWYTGVEQPYTVCRGCSAHYPCPTVRALATHLPDDTKEA